MIEDRKMHRESMMMLMKNLMWKFKIQLSIYKQYYYKRKKELQKERAEKDKYITIPLVEYKELLI